MKLVKAILFDLDDTLLNRDRAVDNLFHIMLEKYYGAVEHSVKLTCYNNLKNTIKETMAMPIKQMFYHRF